MPTPAGHLNGATLLGRSVLCFGLPSRQFVRVRMNRIEARIGRCSMAVRLEHANLTVRDIDGMIRFLQTAFPEFKVRGEGKYRVEPSKAGAGATLDAISRRARCESSCL